MPVVVQGAAGSACVVTPVSIRVAVRAMYRRIECCPCSGGKRHETHGLPVYRVRRRASLPFRAEGPHNAALLEYAGDLGMVVAEEGAPDIVPRSQTPRIPEPSLSVDRNGTKVDAGAACPGRPPNKGNCPYGKQPLPR